MRVVVQRVSDCCITNNGSLIGSIKFGLLTYICIEKNDTQNDVTYLVRKVLGLRIFNDDDGKMNCSILEVDGEIMVVSQFTLCGNTHKGNRPSYNNSANPDTAKKFYDIFINLLKKQGCTVKTGKFQTNMKIKYINDGPVTILIDSKKTF